MVSGGEHKRFESNDTIGPSAIISFLGHTSARLSRSVFIAHLKFDSEILWRVRAENMAPFQKDISWDELAAANMLP
jgi:hypothetical protein